MTKTTYGGWPNCNRLTNGRIELVATTDVGPRIIHLSTPGGENVFGLVHGELGLTGGEQHRLYGGHRLWHAPEAIPRTYWPDNGPVETVIESQTLRLIQAVEGATGIRKEMAVTIIDDYPWVEVRHLLTNVGLWAVELAPWAPTMMNLNGVAIVPLSDRPTLKNLLPDRAIVLWPYTDMRDPRVDWGSRYIMVRQIPEPGEFKVGLNCTAGWAAYWCRNQIFLKCFQFHPGAAYPDFGCSVEVYVCNEFLELETLGPMVRLEPGEAVQHVEHWFLFDGLQPVASEEDVARLVQPLAEEAMEQVAAKKQRKGG